MNKRLLSFLTALLSIIYVSNAQVDVTFRVDMNGETVSGNGVHIAGTINDWNPSATALTDEDSDGIYKVTLSLNPGEFHEFKFINDNDWPGQEIPGEVCSNSTNRYIYVP
ncbi:MAG: carbohydrate-binding module family 20 domain-containing protein, partial [Cyclobacteriaceae bacterium]